MAFLLMALLLQATPISSKFFNDGERIGLRSTRLALNFRGFSRADMIEIVPVGRLEEPSIRVVSAAIRNLILNNRDKSYGMVRGEGRTEAITFTPADLRQDTILIVSVPEGLALQVSFNGNDVPVRGPLKESLFLHNSSVERGKPGAAIALLNERLKNKEIVLPVVPPVNPKARMIHAERPELTKEEIRVLDRLSGDQHTAISFEATVTDTGQVIEVRALSGIPPRTPRGILDKLQDAAMRHSFEPLLVNGKAEGFLTTIVLEMP